MVADTWLPIGFEFLDGGRVISVVDAGLEWRILDTGSRRRVLLVQSSLFDRWVISDLLKRECAYSFEFGARRLSAIVSTPMHVLASLTNYRSPNSKTEAISFTYALRETRAIDPNVPLHDGLYFEKLSRVLPTYCAETGASDDFVLGSWLSGGLNMSVFPLQRMHKVVSWLDPGILVDVVRSAGFEVNELFSLSKEGANEETNVPMGSKQGERNLISRTRFQLPGREVLETFFNEHIIDIVENRTHHKSLGIEFPAAIVLEGPPGCGKTFAVERLVEFFGWPLYFIEASSIASPYIHETSRKVAGIFEQAIEHAPSVVVIDEMEAFLADRADGVGSGHHRVEEVAEFLRRIPKAVKRGVSIIGMTNHIEMIDKAILRRGRFDHTITVGYAAQQEVEELLGFLLFDLPKAHDVDIPCLAEGLSGCPLSDVTYVVREGARLAARERKSLIDNQCLITALGSLPPQDRAARPGRIGFV